MKNSQSGEVGELAARYYDKSYGWKDYAKEAESVLAYLRKHGQHEGGTLLDVGCGTGNFIPHLGKSFDVEGLDLNPSMLNIAREKFPDTTFHQGNMRDFDLGKQFDVVVCLFSAIAYMTTVADLQATIRNFARHLKPGGTMIFDSFIEAEYFRANDPFMLTVDEPDFKLARMNIGKRRGDLFLLDFYFQVATPEGVTRFEEHHELNMFDHSVYRQCMEQAGLTATYFKNGLMPRRGLFIGNK